MSMDHTVSFEDRRRETRHPLQMDVNYRQGDTYLFCRSENISEMGIFLATDAPMGTGSKLNLRFALPGLSEPMEIRGEVAWIDSGEGGSTMGMGVRFISPPPDIRAKIRALIQTMAYLD